jgi:hypothetical protein
MRPYIVLFIGIIAITSSRSVLAGSSIACDAPSGKVPPPISECRAALSAPSTELCGVWQREKRSLPEELEQAVGHLLRPKFGKDATSVANKLWGAIDGAPSIHIEHLVPQLEAARADLMPSTPQLRTIQFVSIRPAGLDQLLSDRMMQSVPIIVLNSGKVYVVAEWRWTVIGGAYFTPTNARVSRLVCPVEGARLNESIRLGSDESILAIKSSVPH